MGIYSYSQNLVVNHNFNDFTSCTPPIIVGGIPIGGGGIGNLNEAVNWSNPSAGSPDFSHTCSGTVPANTFGMENPVSGDGYAGMFVYEPPTEGREYLQNMLSQPLESGKTYCIQFYISLAEGSDFSIDKIGVHFSDVPLTSGNSNPLPVIPQFESSISQAGINGWTIIEGNYTATGGEEYLIIGNFNDNSNTIATPRTPSGQFPLVNSAYYYVDEVFVGEDGTCPVICDLNVEFNALPEKCEAMDGSVSVNVLNGGSAPYTYAWSTGETKDSIANLTSGIYPITITDANGCNHLDQITIENQGLTANAIITDPSCNSCDGSITINPINGTGPYSYLWDANAGNANTQLVNSLCAGTYEVVITDAVGCQLTKSLSISTPGTFDIGIITNSSSDCNTCDGQATAETFGGAGPFTYEWSINNQTTQSVSMLCQGEYTVTITGAPVDIKLPFWEEDFENVACGTSFEAAGYDGGNGAWSVSDDSSPISSTPNKWYVSAQEIGKTSGDCRESCSGTNPFNASLHVGKFASDDGAIYDGSFGSISDIRVESPTIDCSGRSNISLNFDFLMKETTGGFVSDVVSIRYFDGSFWSKIADLYSTPACANGRSWDNYSILLPASADNNPNVKFGFLWENAITSASDTSFAVDNISLSTSGGTTQCPISKTFTLAAENGLDIELIRDSLICLDSANGTISVAVNNGTMPYSFSWNNGATSSSIVDLPAGYYQVTVSDAANCNGTKGVTIDEIAITDPILTPDTSICSGGNNILLRAIPGFSYQWDNGSNSNTTNISPATTTDHFITVTAGKCAIKDSVTIAVAADNITVSNDVLLCNTNGNVWFHASGGDSYLWSTGSDKDSINVSPKSDTTFYVTVTNNCGTKHDSVKIQLDDLRNFSVSSDTSIASGQSITLSASGGNNYAWTPAESLNCTTCPSPIASPDASTTYNVTISSGNNCTAILSINVIVNDDNIVYLPNIFSPNGDGENDIFYVRGSGVEQLNLTIFDRWGTMVFESGDITWVGDRTIGWDGTFNSNELNSAVFFYLLEGNFNDGTPFKEQGNVTLIR